MNRKIESLPEHHGDSADLSYLVFYSYPLTSFFKIIKKKYRPIFIFWPESGIFPSMVDTIRYVPVFGVVRNNHVLVPV